ncbi:MAG: hypothetical protein ACO1QR_01805 [Chthoniobacteraceae bacterium]
MNENITPIGSSAGASGVGSPGTSGGYSGQTGTQHGGSSYGSTTSSGEHSAGLKETVREKSTEAMDALKSKAQTAASDAKDYGRTMVQEQKETLAHKVKEYANAARSASEKLGGENDMLSRPAERAAHQLDRMADYLQNKEPADLFDDLEAFARRRPEIVFGGMFVAGLAAARFFKASSRSSRELYRSSYTGSPSSMGAPSGDIMRTPSTASTSPMIPSSTAGAGVGSSSAGQFGSGTGIGTGHTASGGLGSTSTSSIPTTPSTSSTLPTTPPPSSGELSGDLPPTGFPTRPTP